MLTVGNSKQRQGLPSVTVMMLMGGRTVIEMTAAAQCDLLSSLTSHLYLSKSRYLQTGITEGWDDKA